MIKGAPRPAWLAGGFTIAAWATGIGAIVAGWARTSWPALDLLSLLTCLLAIWLMPAAGARVLTIVFLGLGAALLAVGRVEPIAGLATVGGLRGFIPVILLVPIAGLIFELRAYGPALIGVGGDRLRTDRGIAGAAAVIAHLIGALAGLAALVVGYGLFVEATRGSPARAKLVTTAVLRGYVTTAIWTPASPAVALALLVTGAGPAAFLPWAVPFALIGLGLHLATDRLGHGATGEPPPSAGAAGSRHLVIEFAALLAIFLAGTVALTEVFRLNLIYVVPVIAALTTLGVALGAGKTAAARRWLIVYVRDRTAPKSNEIGLFLAAGVLVAGLQSSGLGGAVGGWLATILGGHSLLLLLTFPPLILLLGLIGLPPNVGLVILAGAIGPSLGDLPPALVAVALSAGVALSLILAPYTIPLFLMAGLTGRSTREIGWAANWRYGLALLALIEIALVLLVGLARA